MYEHGDFWICEMLYANIFFRLSTYHASIRGKKLIKQKKFKKLSASALVYYLHSENVS